MSVPYTINVVTAPTVPVLSLTEAKKACRVDISDDDTDIASYVDAARDWYESVADRSLLTQTIEVRWDAFPGQGEDKRDPMVYRGSDRYALTVPRAPLQSVTTLKYVDLDGNVQTLVKDTDYTVDRELSGAEVAAGALYPETPARIVPAYGTVWPVARAMPGSVRLVAVVGYGDTASKVPESIRQLMRLLTVHGYGQREPVVIGTIVNALPHAIQTLFWRTRNLAA